MIPVRQILERPVAVVAGFAAATVLGAASLLIIPVDLLPRIEVPRFTVRCILPGVSSPELEQRVTVPLEAALQGIDGMKRISARTREGVAVISPEFAWSADAETALLEVRERLDQTLPLLPPGMHRPSVLRVDPMEQPVLRVAVAPRDDKREHGAEEALLAGVSELAAGPLRRRLELVEGVAMVDLSGMRGREILITAGTERISAAGLAPPDLLAPVRSRVVYEAAGQATVAGSQRPVTVTALFDGPAALRELRVPTRPGQPAVRLGDVARVEWAVTEPPGHVRISGREVVELRVLPEPGANVIATAERIREEVARLRAEYREVDLMITADQSAYIRRTVNDVAEAGLFGALLAFGLLILFLRNWSDPLIAGITFPVCVFTTILFLHLLGIHLHLLSLGGLALGVGMLGDNAVIVVENVRRCREQGMPLRQAVEKGASGITVPAAVSTLTNVAVFLPVLMLDGIGRQLFGEMAVAMTCALLVSLLVATTLVPVLIHRFPAGAVQRFPATAPGAAWITPILHRVIRRRTCVLTVAASAMLLSTFWALALTTGETPALDMSALEVVLDFPEGTPGRTIARAVRVLEQELLREEGVAGLRVETGTLEGSDIWEAEQVSSARAVITIRLAPGVDPRSVRESVQVRTKTLERLVTGLQVTAGPPATAFERLMDLRDRGIAIRVSGIGEERWREWSGRVLAAVSSVPGFTEISTDLGSPLAEYALRADPVKAAARQVPLETLQERIRADGGYGEILTLPGHGGLVRVRCVQATDGGEGGMEEALDRTVRSAIGPVPLRAVASGRWLERPAGLYREDGKRVYLVTGNAGGRSVAKVVGGLRTALAEVPLPPEASVTVGLLSREAADSSGSVWMAILLSMVLMYILFAAEYDSMILPLVVLASSPLAFIGAVAAVAASGEPIGVLSLAGLVITVGAVDNDAVIAVDLIARKVRQGIPRDAAIVQGMISRLRPIVITSLTTILGVIPLLVQSGSGSVLVRSLAIPLAGGLAASTAATVLVIPALLASVRWRPGFAGRGSEEGDVR